jgi:glycosyltransferase involved in cell wall biosynthesis
VRIVHLSADWHPTGGVSSYVRLVAPAHVAAGHDVLVVHAGETDADGVTDGVTVRGFPSALRPGAGAERFVPAVLGAVRAFAPDIAHFHASNNFAIENAVRALVPTLKTLHTLGFCPAGTKYHAATDTICTFRTGLMCVPRQGYLRCTMSKRPTVWWSNYTLATRANRHHQSFGQLLVTSAFVRDQAVATGFDGDRIAVVPYFTTLPPDVPPVTTRNVLYIGRVAREKGADLVLEAMARVPGDWRVVIVGDGIDMAYLRQRALALSITDRVVFKGWKTGAALDDEYRAAAVVVVPSRLPEPFGITGIEAMAWQRPVVAFDTGGIPEWLDNGAGGFRVAPGDVPGMAARIQALLDDPVLAHDVAARGRARVAQDFTGDPHLRRLQPIYEQVMAHGV